MQYHLYSIWLFTFSDLKTIVGPKTVFGILNALAFPIFTSSTSPHSLPNLIQILLRLPLIAFWAWINLLPFAICNQRQPGALLEDQHNKPWRPLPSGRMTPTQAKRLAVCLYAVACGVSARLGSLPQCMALVALGLCYNEAGLADSSCIARNAINGVGFACYAAGAVEVALGTTTLRLLQQPGFVRWLAVVAAVVFSTVQMQDFYDQRGDALRGRRTVPLVVGDGAARWLTAGLMAFWSVFCPWYWGLRLAPSAAFGVLGVVILARTLTKRSVEEDKKTFLAWNVWMAFLYALPLTKLLSER